MRRRYWSCVYCGEATCPPLTLERLLQTCFDPSRDDGALRHVWRPRWADPSLRDPSIEAT